MVGLAASMPNQAYSQPPGKDGTPFCAEPDWRPGDPCGVEVQDPVDLGVSRTVRLVYFVPNDRLLRAEVVQRLKDEIRAIQTFYGNQMEAHGYGNNTFRIENDSRGEPVVHVVNGRHSDSHYIATREKANTVFSEIGSEFDFKRNVYLIVIDNSTARLTGEIDGLGKRYSKVGGGALVTDEFHWAKAAHELGHAFGLEHNFHDGGYIMSYGPGYDRLSASSADSLAGHPYLNPDMPIAQGTRPTIELVSPLLYPAGSQSAPIELKIADSGGLRQVLLLVKTLEPHSAAGQRELKAYQALDGGANAFVQFVYDGVIPSNGSTDLSNPFSHPITIQAIDSEGNSNREDFTLVELSRSHIVTLRGHTDRINSVSFSPDHITLASASGDGAVKLWDVETLERIAALEGHSNAVRSLSFSPDGKVLASGSWDGAVSLWNTETKENIGTLRHRQISFLSFSPDGRTLVSCARDGTIKLWNPAAEENISTLRHGKVTSASFSSDGRTFATGGWDGTVKIWNLVTRSVTATLEYSEGGIRCVSYSPDGSLLAAGAWGEGIWLWDTAAYSSIGILDHKWATSVSYSPDGNALASGGDTTIKLWDIASGDLLTTFRHSDRITSVSFSPDGSPLASGTDTGAVELWDTSEWVHSVKFEIPDRNLRTAIRSALGMPPGARIRRADVAALTKLGARNASITDLTGLEWATNLKTLLLPNNSISDLSPLKGLIHLSWIDLGGNSITDISPLAGLTQLRLLFAGKNSISDITPLSGLINLTFVTLERNNFSDLSPLAANTGLGREDAIQVKNNPLSYRTIDTDIPILRKRGVQVQFTKRPRRAEDLNRDGRVDILDLVLVAAGLQNEDRNQATDVNGDGVVNVQDLVLVAIAFDAAAAPSPPPDASHTLTVEMVRGWLAAARSIKVKDVIVKRGIGVFEQLMQSLTPRETALLANYPNPFNPETWIPYRLAENADVTLTIFDSNGVLVRRLEVGYQPAGHYTDRHNAAYWDGCNAGGEPVVSGIYFYELATPSFRDSRRMVIVK